MLNDNAIIKWSNGVAGFNKNYHCWFFWACSWDLKTQTAKSSTPQGHFSEASGGWSASYQPYPGSSSPPAPVSLPHPLCVSVSLCSFTNPKSHSSPSLKKIHCHPHPPPPPPLLTCAPAGLSPPCWVKWTVPVSEELRAPRSVQPGSARLS